MSRILLADDSPHAQRMGERILLDEGYEVVTVTDGETALVRLADVDPDLVLADAGLPIRSGYELCEHVKRNPRHRHTRVVLLETMLEPVDVQRARQVNADGVLRKPFEASLVIEAIRPLVHAAVHERGDSETAPGPAAPESPKVVVIEPEAVRAAVTVALNAAMPALIDELTGRVLVALGYEPRKQTHSNSEPCPTTASISSPKSTLRK